MDVDLERVKEEMILDEDLDPRIIGSDSLASPAKELETFPVKISDPTQMLQVGKKLVEKMKEKMKQFMRENIDVFEWKHSDIVGIDPSVACHVLKVDPKVRPKIQKNRSLSAREQIGNTMEVYIDDMLVKSVNVKDHIGHLREMFGILHKYCVKLNPLTESHLENSLATWLINAGLRLIPRRSKRSLTCGHHPLPEKFRALRKDWGP
ncbi:RNase H domain-containing protein [Abeliophyllum distichum]|uniref:RNase H domain-containing protein n=1 Tax=Abeliophyllum distichum TaxID=126358 RepID=A0ABD1QWK2_9LAMI